jgi:hypothetical protein
MRTGVLSRGLDTTSVYCEQALPVRRRFERDCSGLSTTSADDITRAAEPGTETGTANALLDGPGEDSAVELDRWLSTAMNVIMRLLVHGQVWQDLRFCTFACVRKA